MKNKSVILGIAVVLLLALSITSCTFVLGEGDGIFDTDKKTEESSKDTVSGGDELGAEDTTESAPAADSSKGIYTFDNGDIELKTLYHKVDGEIDTAMYFFSGTNIEPGKYTLMWNIDPACMDDLGLYLYTSTSKTDGSLRFCFTLNGSKASPAYPADGNLINTATSEGILHNQYDFEIDENGSFFLSTLWVDTTSSREAELIYDKYATDYVKYLALVKVEE